MNRREQIIILLAVLMAAYGVLDYFVLSKKGASGKDEDKVTAAVQQADTFAATATARLTAMSVKNKGRSLSYTKKMAETPWPRDPFITHTKVIEKEEQLSDADMPEMIYSGFIKLGNRILGVINGMEYRVGELVVDIGYKVHQITASKVILLTESNKQIIIYLQED